MCDPGEQLSLTLKREFFEEALNSLDMSKEQLGALRGKLHKFFNEGDELYRGYVDDPRNTDNAWMETVAYLFHDKDGRTFRDVVLNAGDDAKKVKWMDISDELKLYASHKELIEKAVHRLDAHWSSRRTSVGGLAVADIISPTPVPSNITVQYEFIRLFKCTFKAFDI